MQIILPPVVQDADDNDAIGAGALLTALVTGLYGDHGHDLTSAEATRIEAARAEAHRLAVDVAISMHSFAAAVRDIRKGLGLPVNAGDMLISAMPGTTAAHGDVIGHAQSELDAVISSFRNHPDVGELRSLQPSMHRFLILLDAAIERAGAASS